MKNFFRLTTLLLICTVVVSQWTQRVTHAAAGPALTVNAAAGNSPISPYIYGMNFPASDLQQELQLPISRFGGNRTSRYNWFTNTSGAGVDWYFENRAEPTTSGQTPPNGSWTDQYHEANLATNTETLLTMPMVGWRTKDATSCSYSIAKYGAQQATSPYRPDCGNGRTQSGARILTNDPTDAHLSTTTSYYVPWMQHLVNKYGTGANGGVQFWSLDNEPDLWHETHFDIWPVGASFAQIRDASIAYGSMIKAADPTAQTLGVVGWGWLSFRYSGKDKQACDVQGQTCWDNPPDAAQYGTPAPWFLNWFLQQMKAHEQTSGVRVVDYVDIHYYPQSVNGFNDDLNDTYNNAMRFRAVKSMWDRTYIDESWINQPIYFIPRMKEMIANNYPGTKTAITEYRFGGLKYLAGALAQVDVLGVFGREGLNMATIWDAPTSSQPGAYAFRMFLNYDGNRGRFGDVSVSATSANQDQVSIYAAKRSSDGALTLMVVNKDPTNDYTSNLSLSGFSPSASAQVYRYGSANLNAIVRQSDQAVSSSGFTATFPAYSATLIVIPAGSISTTATATATRTHTLTLTPTNTQATFQPPTNTATATLNLTATPTYTKTHTPTPTRTHTPTFTFTPVTVVPGGLQVQLQNGGADSGQMSQFRYRIVNTGSSAQSNIAVRLYIKLDGTQPISSYVLDKYWDQSGVVSISGPTLHAGNVYYYTLSYGANSLPAGASWEYQGAFHLSDWSNNFDGANDWWHTGYTVGNLPGSFVNTNYIPAYVGSSLVWGNQP
jgi:hypothetical protein